MSRRNKNRNKNQFKKEYQTTKKLSSETMHTIWALVFIAIALILTLAGFHKAGSAGNFIFDFFYYIFGWGYTLIPITFIAVSFELLRHKEEPRIYGPAFWGAILFLFSTHGDIDIFWPKNGGIFGILSGYPKTWFGDTAWGIILSICAIIGIVMIFDKPITIRRAEDKNLPKNPISSKAEESISKAEAIEKQNDKTKSDKETDEDSKSTKEEKMKLNIFSNKKDIPEAHGVIKKFSDYKAPPIELLKTSIEKPSAGDLRANANIIQRTLESFGIPVEMGEINIGPKVTRYTLRPAEGIKLSRITALNPDLALALSAHPIRIEAPIPGKPYVGIEVPNKTAAIVRLGNLISYPEFAQAGMLGFCLGRDVTGEPIFANLEKMPHLLIAGATGSGKSITLHAVLTSLLFKNSPKTLKLILIDPKRVEMSAYNGMPHLIAPVVIQGKKALSVFKWALNEMDKRYELLLKAGARDVQSYNKKNSEDPLPFIVIVVDEMADLMANYGRDIENAIVRLAQMARATGIHLILSTQRPSVEVITGLIKANITSRIALQVASQIDSRTILDTSGAEKLLGGGDLLFISAELSKPRRIQGAYIGEEEIKKVTHFIKENNADWIETSEEELSFTQTNSEEEPSSRNSSKDVFEEFGENSDDDDMLQEAIEVVKEAQKASASLLQRRLKVGYARAARLLDLMEEKNLIGPGDGAKAREVYIIKDDQTTGIE